MLVTLDLNEIWFVMLIYVKLRALPESLKKVKGKIPRKKQGLRSRVISKKEISARVEKKIYCIKFHTK